MKSLFYISIFLFSINSSAQQLEHYTQYQHNQFAFNPAVAGTKNCLDVRTGYRFQWAGIDGAPQTGFVNVHAPLRLGKKKRSSFGPKHGIGGQIKRDLFGPFSFLSLHAAYALHMPITRKWTTSLGVSFGFKQSVYNAANITTEISDPAFPGTSQSFIVFPDAKIGAWVTNKKTYVGLSVHNLFGNTFSKVGPGAKAQRHVYFTAGHSFSLEKNWSFVPSVFVLWTKSTPIDFHLSALLDLSNKFSFGLGMRRTDAITAQVRVKFFNWISLGYSFDFIISKLKGNMWQTHEITGGFNSCSNYGNSSTTECPSFE